MWKDTQHSTVRGGGGSTPSGYYAAPLHEREKVQKLGVIRFLYKPEDGPRVDYDHNYSKLATSVESGPRI